MPFRSPLWKHLELIRSMRRARATWEEVAQEVAKREGRPVHYTTIYNFFKRYAARLKKTGRGQPLGFEPLPGEAPAPAPPAAAKPAPNPSAPPGADDDLLEPVEPETVTDRKIRAMREKRQRDQPPK